MKEDLILESFKQYHNANWHDGDNTFDEHTYAKSNGGAASSDTDFDDQFVQDCYDHYEAGYKKAWQEVKAQAIPDGFVIVPIEPTQKMVDEFPEVHYQDTYAGDCSLWVEDEIIKLGYKAMIRAVE